jgi:predicted transcriptional regulator
MNPLGRKSDLRRKLADGKTLDDALTELRVSGYSIIDCIFAVHKVQHCEFIEAKQTVHLSLAWADM